MKTKRRKKRSWATVEMAVSVENAALSSLDYES